MRGTPGHHEQPAEHRPAVLLPPSGADSAAVVDPGVRGGAGSLARGAGLVAPALTVVNLAGYVLAVVASRALPSGRYGELTALLGVLLVASVPALATQAVVARSVARRPDGEPRGPRERRLLLGSALTGAAVSGVVVLSSPLVALGLHTGIAGPLWVAAGVLPLALLSGCQGLLQGEERFGALAVLICAQAGSKVIGTVPLLLGGGAHEVLAALAAGTLAAALLGLLLARPRGAGGQAPAMPGPREVALAAGGLLALLALANLDLLLARGVLPDEESGRYAVGSVLSKAAFWLPQAVAVVVFPRLTDPVGGRALLRRAALVVGGLGLLELAGAAVLARPVLEITFGQQYGSLAPLAPVFVLQGACLAVVQLVVYRAIATGDGRAGRLVAVAAVLVAAGVLLQRPDETGQVITVAAGVALLLAATALLLPDRETAATDTPGPAAAPVTAAPPPS